MDALIGSCFQFLSEVNVSFNDRHLHELTLNLWIINFVIGVPKFLSLVIFEKFIKKHILHGPK